MSAAMAVTVAVTFVWVGLAVVLVLTLLLEAPGPVAVVPLTLSVAALAAQLLFVRPRLTRRSNAVLAGNDTMRSHAHHAYVALESVKLLALLFGGIAALATA